LKKADLVHIGKVLRSQGKEGHLKIRLHLKELAGLTLTKVCLARAGGFEEYEVESLGLDRNSHFLKLKGVDTLPRSDELAGLDIYIPEASFRPLPGGRFYDFELIGSRVVTVGGTEVGTVSGVLSPGGADILVVVRGNEEYYIPFVEAICRRVDPAGKEILIDPPDGLLELNEI
jgi:16S rRNA processing protein RimM